MADTADTSDTADTNGTAGKRILNTVTGALTAAVFAVLVLSVAAWVSGTGLWQLLRVDWWVIVLGAVCGGVVRLVTSISSNLAQTPQNSK